MTEFYHKHTANGNRNPSHCQGSAADADVARPVNPLEPLAHHPYGWMGYVASLARTFGSTDAAIMLIKMCRFSMMPTSVARDGWFYESREQFYVETGVKRAGQEKARATFMRLGLVKEELRGIPRRLWFLVNSQAVFDFFNEALKADATVLTDDFSQHSSAALNPTAGRNQPASGANLPNQQGEIAQPVGIQQPSIDSKSSSFRTSKLQPDSLSAQSADLGSSFAENENGEFKFLILAENKQTKVDQAVRDIATMTRDDRCLEQIETLAARVLREGFFQDWHFAKSHLERKHREISHPNAYFVAVLEDKLNGRKRVPLPDAPFVPSASPCPRSSAVTKVDEIANQGPTSEPTPAQEAVLLQRARNCVAPHWRAMGETKCKHMVEEHYAAILRGEFREEFSEWHEKYVVEEDKTLGGKDADGTGLIENHKLLKTENSRTRRVYPRRVSRLSSIAITKLNAEFDAMTDKEQILWIIRARAKIGLSQPPAAALLHAARNIYVAERMKETL